MTTTTVEDAAGHPLPDPTGRQAALGSTSALDPARRRQEIREVPRLPAAGGHIT